MIISKRSNIRKYHYGGSGIFQKIISVASDPFVKEKAEQLFKRIVSKSELPIQEFVKKKILSNINEHI